MFSPWRLAAGLTLWALGTAAWTQAGAAQLVRIGAAHFPPYTVRPEQGADTGLLPQLVEALNAAQTDYQFVVVPTSIPRRFRDFEQGRVDMAIFENPSWGWQNIAHTSVDMGLKMRRFLSLSVSPVATRVIFPTSPEALAVFSGYHYAFADFNPDPKNMPSVSTRR
uniref:Solute-binding protein family 3/N-terminal domain-containing protein n=1 Tax=Pseudomonas fluorescens TaxID=294 RepID=Q9AJ73_PSEFL|nr:unknown [Pseudomonas fluorescens]